MIGWSSDKAEAEAQGAESTRELKLSRVSKGHGSRQHTGNASKEGRDCRVNVFSIEQFHLICPAVVNLPLYTATECFGAN
jgi:hypothetical protein